LFVSVWRIRVGADERPCSLGKYPGEVSSCRAYILLAALLPQDQPRPLTNEFYGWHQLTGNGNATVKNTTCHVTDMVVSGMILMPMGMGMVTRKDMALRSQRQATMILMVQIMATGMERPQYRHHHHQL
jgi:hypothetical protein